MHCIVRAENGLLSIISADLLHNIVVCWQDSCVHVVRLTAWQRRAVPDMFMCVCVCVWGGYRNSLNFEKNVCTGRIPS